MSDEEIRKLREEARRRNEQSYFPPTGRSGRYNPSEDQIEPQKVLLGTIVTSSAAFRVYGLPEGQKAFDDLNFKDQSGQHLLLKFGNGYYVERA